MMAMLYSPYFAYGILAGLIIGCLLTFLLMVIIVCEAKEAKE